MSVIGDLSQVPGEFLTALADLRQAKYRSEVRLEEIPAPSRLAPFAVAMGTEVFPPAVQGHRPVHGPATAAFDGDDQQELATGRFILLYDPERSTIWDGTFRVVTYIRARLEPDMGNDALLGSVAWTWLTDALQNNGAAYRSAGGTATRILSESYGTLEAREDTIDVELRASWTPDANNVQDHLEAWTEMVCTFAGLPPLPHGVVSLPNRRRN